MSHIETLSRSLLHVLREVIPKDSSTHWHYNIDLANSCYQIEHTTAISATLSGQGGKDLDALEIEVCVRVVIGQSFGIQSVRIDKVGVQDAIQAFIRLPKDIVVCRECGRLRVGPDSFCKSCLFLELYAASNQIDETCTICQERAFRTVLPCGHFFHMTCLLSMDPEEARCPNCRVPLPDQVVKQIFGEFDYSDDDDGSDSDSDDESDRNE